MANIQISDLCLVDADLEMVSLTDKELSVVGGMGLVEFLTTKGSVDWSDAAKQEWADTWGIPW